MNPNDLFSMTEQLYTAKMFLLIISVFNVLINLYAVFMLIDSGKQLFSLLAALVLVFNTLFAAVAVRNWRKNELG